MQKDINQELINELLEMSDTSNPVLHEKIQKLIDIYHKQNTINKQLLKENNFFLKECDKKNLINHDTKDKIIEQKARLAAMGEMIDAVAHQWKQPLNAMSMMMYLLEDDFEEGNVTCKYIQDLGSSVHLQIDYMVDTLNEFRNFLKPASKNEDFYISTIIENVQILLKDELTLQNLNIDVNIHKKAKIFGNKNELKHLFINLINNSIDAFNENKISIRKLCIRCSSKDKQVIIEVEDNAGGIPEHIINDIFKPNITTKPEGKGSGIGLYMSSQIVIKNNGTIKVKNVNNGALFTISLQSNYI